MRGVSLKVKLTALYTFFMVLVTCVVLAVLFSLSTREVLSSTRTGWSAGCRRARTISD